MTHNPLYNSSSDPHVPHVTSRHMTQAIELFPEDALALRMRGQMLMELGRPKLARGCLQRALELVPDDAITMARYSPILKLIGSCSYSTHYCSYITSETLLYRPSF